MLNIYIFLDRIVIFYLLGIKLLFAGKKRKKEEMMKKEWMGKKFFISITVYVFHFSKFSVYNSVKGVTISQKPFFFFLKDNVEFY